MRFGMLFVATAVAGLTLAPNAHALENWFDVAQPSVTNLNRGGHTIGEWLIAGGHVSLCHFGRFRGCGLGLAVNYMQDIGGEKNGLGIAITMPQSIRLDGKRRHDRNPYFYATVTPYYNTRFHNLGVSVGISLSGYY